MIGDNSMYGRPSTSGDGKSIPDMSINGGTDDVLDGEQLSNSSSRGTMVPLQSVGQGEGEQSTRGSIAGA